jgi:hypothetical protein
MLILAMLNLMQHNRDIEEHAEMRRAYQLFQ